MIELPNHNWAAEPVPFVQSADAFTHLVAWFPFGQVFYPPCPPPRGVVVKADGDKLTIKCAEWGSLYFHFLGNTPFDTYLHQLSFRATRVVVAGIYFEDQIRTKIQGVAWHPGIAWAAGAPSVDVRLYPEYPHKKKPHRIFFPDGVEVNFTIHGSSRVACSTDDLREVYPRGLPVQAMNLIKNFAIKVGPAA